MTTSDEARGFFARWSRAVVRRRGAVVFAWIAVVAVLNVFVPQLEAVIGQSKVPFVPASSPSVRALPHMDQKFGGSGANSLVFVVLEDHSGLSETDRAYYTDLVRRLETADSVTSVQGTVSQPELAEALDSADGKATYIPVGLRGQNGSPEATSQINALRALADEDRPESLSVHIAGSGASAADMQGEIESSMVPITAVTIVLITIILLVIYRSLVTALVALTLIGISLGTSRAVTALLGLEFFDVSTFTASLLTAVVLGAGTDYGVFLISRFHERLRAGDDPEEAAITANRRVGAVIIASAGTTAVACAGMALAEVSIFRTTGPAIAVSLLITLLAGVTLSPALLAIAGTRGYARPSVRGDDGGRWQRISDLVVARPGRILVVGLVLLGLLAAVYPTGRLSYDTRSVQPAGTDSNLGYAALQRHFPPTESMPEYVLVDADHDMRNPRDLAALERMSSVVSQVDGVREVRSITRPSGEPIAEANIGRQVGEVGDRLGEARARVAGEQQGGASALADGTGRLAGGAGLAVQGAQQLLNGLNSANSGMGAAGEGTGQASEAARRLTDGAAQLAEGLDVANEQTAVAVDGLELAHGALQSDPLCSVSPACRQARDGIQQIYTGQRDQLLPGLSRAAGAAHALADGNGELTAGIDELRSGIAAARTGIGRLAEGERTLRDRLGELSGGADRLRTGAEDASASVQELERGLAGASDFLTQVRQQGDVTMDAGGFYLPANALRDPRMALARGMFLSEDGKTARLMVLHENDPLGRAAMRTTDEFVRTAQRSMNGTGLHGSALQSTGPASVNADLARASAADFQKFAVIAILAVLMILMLLLRSVVAPLYLLLSVVLSFAAAMGVSVLFWQHVIGSDVDWSVQPIAFVILVAVGADYNMLLMSRIREESTDDSRLGVGRSLVTTGRVITAAGVTFAASMFALLAGTVTILAQIGFTIGAGLLLDTFVVRTLVIPAIASVAGRWSWWPSKAARTRASENG